MNAATMQTLTNRQWITLTEQGRRPVTFKVVTLRDYCAEQDARYNLESGTELRQSIERDAQLNRPTQWAWISEPAMVLCNCDCEARAQQMAPREAVEYGAHVKVEGEDGTWQIARRARFTGLELLQVDESR